MAAIDLHGQVKHAHWNVRGPAFIAIHELFDEIADEVEDYSYALAKRSAAVGGTAQRTVEVAAKCSFLVPYDLGITDEKEHIFTFLGAPATRPLSRSGMIDRSGTSFRADAADGILARCAGRGAIDVRDQSQGFRQQQCHQSNCGLKAAARFQQTCDFIHFRRLYYACACFKAEMSIETDGNVDLRDTGITALPDNLSVGGHLYLDGTGITTCPRTSRSEGEYRI